MGAIFRNTFTIPYLYHFAIKDVLTGQIVFEKECKTFIAAKNYYTKWCLNNLMDKIAYEILDRESVWIEEKGKVKSIEFNRYRR